MMHGRFEDYHLAAKKSGVEWTGVMLNPLYGCSPVSEGCANCYAARDAARWTNHFAGLAERTPNGGARWTQEIQFRPDALKKPLSWRDPHLVFLGGMSDLFHEKVAFEYIDRVFDMMAATPQHTYQLLTKRIGRALQYLEHRGRIPLPNVWIGVSVENQLAADERIPVLHELDAAVKWISYEPALGSVDLGYYFLPRVLTKIGWVVCGGESGKFARKMNPDWARLMRDECQRAGVPFFFKQWGEFNEHGERVGKKQAGSLLDGVEWKEFPRKVGA